MIRRDTATDIALAYREIEAHIAQQRARIGVLCDKARAELDV